MKQASILLRSVGAVCVTILGMAVFILPTARADLVAHWTADGDFSDSSGNGHHGTGFGNTSFVGGVFGQAFDFDGSGDYIVVPHSNAFNFGTSDFSVTLRANFDRSTLFGGVIDKDNFNDPSTSNYEGWLFNTDVGNGGVGWLTRDRPAIQTNNRHATANFATDTWYSFTASRESNVLRLYVDGILVDTTAETSPTNVNNSIDLIIGGLQPSGFATQFFDGQVDDIAIFDHALSQSEITRIFNAGVSAVPEPSSLLLFAIATAVVANSRSRKKRNGDSCNT